MQTFRVKCVNDSFKPSDIPLSSWVKKDNFYTVIDAFHGFGGVLIFQLEEIDLTPFPPYKGFDAKRFVESDNLVEELIEELNLQLEAVT